ncbi:DUF3801 domain-containing protein [Anaeromassilibacillus senegalensis]|uniref:DUF3801 domain-containing protein n=2 Tax=Clostridia TaxID=186801 RepID=A0ABS9MJP2_9FIRM|nr:DUF3801 domain-containing protein [Anaeromassilibacillus senegalensis]MCG4611023.1 DUF3801 domain-containing protein [Anaeromassilibacillus senegalensis]
MRDNPYKDLPPLERRPDGSLYRMTPAQKKQAASLVRRECCCCEDGNCIVLDDGDIKAFERTARKYGIDFALKKDSSEQPPRYLVFFKGRDVDVMTQAFKEFSARAVKKQERPSLREQLAQKREQSKAKHREKIKVKTKERGAEL